MYYAQRRVYNSVNSEGSIEYWKFKSYETRNAVVAAKPGMLSCRKPNKDVPVKLYSHSIDLGSTIRLVAAEKS